MKKTFVYLVALFLFAVLVSCDTGQIECIRASDTVISETRDLKDFQGVVFNTSGDVILSQGADYAVSLEGPDNVLELTNTSVENGLLLIGTQNCFNGAYDITVRVTAPEYQLINMSGIGSLTTEGTISGDVIQLELLGIGEVDADFEADSLYTTISGQFSNISLGGAVKLHQIISSGNATVNAFPLTTEKTDVSLLGLGDSYVTADSALTVIIKGTGDVYYQGNPDIEKEILGEGDVIDAN